MASGSTRGEASFHRGRVQTTNGQAAIRLTPHLQTTLYMFPLETAGGSRSKRLCRADTATAADHTIDKGNVQPQEGIG